MKIMKTTQLRVKYGDDTELWMLAIVKSKSGKYYHIERGPSSDSSIASIGKYYRIFDNKISLALELWDKTGGITELSLGDNDCIDYYGSPSNSYEDSFMTLELKKTKGVKNEKR